MHSNDQIEIKKAKNKIKLYKYLISIIIVCIYLNIISLGFLGIMWWLILVFEIILLIVIIGDYKFYRNKLKKINVEFNKFNHDSFYINKENGNEYKMVNELKQSSLSNIKIKAILYTFLFDVLPSVLFVSFFIFTIILYNFNSTQIIKSGYYEFITSILSLPLGIVFIVCLCISVPSLAIGGPIQMAKSTFIRTSSYTYEVIQQGNTIRINNAADTGVAFLVIHIFLFIFLLPITFILWVIKLLRILINREYANIICIDYNFFIDPLIKKNTNSNLWSKFKSSHVMISLLMLLIAFVPTPIYFIQSINHHAKYLSFKFSFEEHIHIKDGMFGTYYSTSTYIIPTINSSRAEPLEVKGELFIKDLSSNEYWQIDIDISNKYNYYTVSNDIINFLNREKLDFYFDIKSIKYDKGIIYYGESLLFSKPYRKKAYYLGINSFSHYE